MASELRHHFWDTSSIVPLLVREPETDRRTSEFRSCPEMIVWWGTRLECVSALARRKRETSIGSEAFDQAMARLDLLCEQWHSVGVIQKVVIFLIENFLTVHWITSLL